MKFMQYLKDKSKNIIFIIFFIVIVVVGIFAYYTFLVTETLNENSVESENDLKLSTTDSDNKSISDEEPLIVIQKDSNFNTNNDSINKTDETNIDEIQPDESDTNVDVNTDNNEGNIDNTEPDNSNTENIQIDENNETNIGITEPNNSDTDNDLISDYDEINKYKTDPHNPDTDNDSINDYDEINNYKTNPCNPDTDGDGLLDGKAQYINNKKIAPVDPQPLKVNGPKGIWKKQIQIENQQNIPYYLTTFYEYNPNQDSIEKISEINWNELKNASNLFNEILKLPILKEIASKTLMFRLDNGGIVLHSQTNEDVYEYVMSEAKENLPNDKYYIFKKAIKYLGIEENMSTWQRNFGFNKLYDEAFRVGTNNNMRSGQIFFKDSSGTDYVLWLWCGDYLSLGTGAEMGLYKKNTSVESEDDLEHWECVTFELPMTLNLYNYYNENNIEHIFSWAPTKKQWWITGFNTNYPDVDVTKNVTIGTINFSEHKDMYNSMKIQISNNNQMKDFVIFDDTDSTVWIYWYHK